MTQTAKPWIRDARSTPAGQPTPALTHLRLVEASTAVPPGPLIAGPTREPALLADERRLCAAALAGDGRAFAELVQPHLAMLLRVATRTTRERSLGEDAVQEALVIAARELRHYQPGTSLRAWLASVVAARAFTLLRGEVRRRQRDEAMPEPTADATPEEHMRGQELRAKIDAILAELPEKRRMAVILRLDGGLDYDEIAHAIGSTPESARALVHLAVKALRQALQGGEP